MFLTLQAITPKMARHSSKTRVAFPARFLKYIKPIWNIMHYKVQAL